MPRTSLAASTRPHRRAVLHEQVRERLFELREEVPRPAAPRLREHVGEVVVIASSSRGGSSVLAEALRASGRALHFPAEVNAFLSLADLVYPLTGERSDALTADEVNDNADAWLSEQVGHPADALTDEPRFALELAERLTLQWPSVVVTVEQVAGWMRDTLAELGGTFSDAALFHARFLARVHRHDPRVNPYYYDLPGALVAAHCPEAPPPCGPPSEDFIEEPPFVCVRPWRSATAEEMASMPLVIKTPSNVYRLDALRALFPAARLRIVHLVRNPAGSINGLIDGWLHHGFFSHQVDLRLGIRGYSDRFPEWGGSWWKFDLPPGWESCRKASLVEVCAYQWRAAHEAILSFLERNPDISSECLRFEDLVGSAMRRGQAASAIGAWMGLPDDDACLRTLREGLPPVMATTAPRRRRWEQRASELLPVLQHPDVMEMVERLGYADDPAAWE